MADKELNIKVTATADLNGVEDLQSSLEDVKTVAEEVSSELSRNFDESAESADGATKSVEELGEEASKPKGDGVRDIADAAREGSDAVKGLRDDMEGIGTSMGINDASMMLMTAEQLRGYGNEMEGFSHNLNEAQITMGQLATQTGMAENELTGMINNISNVTFPKEEAMMYVKSLDQIGVSQQNLGKSATDLDRINDAFGMGAQTVNSLGQEMSVLGVDMNNVSSSYNALAYANANTVGGMDNFYSFLRKYDADLNQLGYDMDQTAVIIAATTQKYGGGKAALSGLSKALEEADGDSRKLEEALGLQEGALDNASQMTGEYEGVLLKLADEEMEHKTVVERLGAAWEDLSMSLAPVLSPMGSVIGLVGKFGSFTMGINGILTLAETFGILNKANLALIPSQIAEGIAGNFAIAWVLIAIAVILILVGVLWYLYNNNESVRQAIDNFIATLQQLAGIIYSAVINAINTLASWVNRLWNIVQTVIMGLVGAVQSGNGNILQSIANVIVYLAQLPSRIATIFLNIIAKALGFGDNFVQRMQQTAINSVNNFISNISKLPSRLYQELSNTYSYVSKWASELPQKFWNAGVDAVKNFLSALGIASPGTMQRMLIWEVSEMGRRIPDESQKLLRNVNQLGANIVDEFGNPTLSVEADDSINNLSNMAANDIIIDNLNAKGNEDQLGAEYNFTINIGNVDNEERVNEIVEAVRKALAWSNTTAGRTV